MEQRPISRAEAKSALEASRTAQVEAWKRCHPVCQCGFVPCPQAKLHYCDKCGDVKKAACRKSACVGQGPLLLTFRPAVPLLNA